MPTICKIPTGWQAKVRLKGHPVQTKVFDTKARAAAWGHAVEAKLREQATGLVRATLQDAIDRYISDVCPTHKSGDNERKRLLALARTPGLLPVGRQLREVAPTDLSRFRDTRLAQVSVATVRKEMTILRSVLESARRDWGMLEVNPISDVKRPPAPAARKRLFTDDERDRIVAALGFEGEVVELQHQVAVALLLAFETGMRAGELLGLEWGTVNMTGRFVTLIDTKNSDDREVPLSTRAVELLQCMQGVDTVNVFTVTSASLDALFRKARDKCGIKGLHFHDSRANAITAMSKKLDVLDLARSIGHRDLKNLLIYYRKSAGDIAGSLG